MTEITSRLSTALADSYAIESHVGKGGKATVYLVEDSMHWEITFGGRNLSSRTLSVPVIDGAL